MESVVTAISLDYTFSDIVDRPPAVGGHLALQYFEGNRSLDPVQTSDLTLLQRITQSDQYAFAEFYDRYSPRVLGFILKIARNRNDAEEILQETFWQVWKNASNYDQQRSAPHVWLFLLARSRSIDFLRRKPPNPQPTDHPHGEFKAGPSSNLESRESNHQVQQALAALPQDQAQCINMAFYEGLTHMEIAQRLSIPLGTVKTRIRTGMIKLKSILHEVPV